MTIKNKIDVAIHVTECDNCGNVVCKEERGLSDIQVTMFRTLCDECFVQTKCELGAECVLYEDREYRTKEE